MSRPFPAYQFEKLLLDHDALKYNPTREWIFPSPFHAGRHLKNARAEWYLYYSPHDRPGGICLAFADKVDGPYTEYEANPIIGKDWDDYYSVSHVASPHPLWMPEENKLFLWFHGENDVTRYAGSEDGIHFHYEGVALTAANFEGISECSYARVFPHEIPSLDARYVFLMMGNRSGNRHIYFAYSPDARKWTVKPDPLIWALEENGGQTSAPYLLKRNGATYVLHHCDWHNGAGNIFATEVSPDFTMVGETVEIFHASEGEPDLKRVGDPFPVFLDGQEEPSLLYCAGPRLKGVLAVARPVPA
jgi:hypothetical protein